ncbi:MAG: hypothetical protein WCW33_03140 [Candidatus Babeliales bacterium]|jgi:hypothetical protein
MDITPEENLRRKLQEIRESSAHIPGAEELTDEELRKLIKDACLRSGNNPNQFWQAFEDCVFIYKIQRGRR